MKQDELGQYEETEIPYDLSLPIRVDEENQALTDSEGKIIAIYRFTRDTLDRSHLRRKLEFIVSMAKGLLMVDKGKVFVRKGVQYQNGELIVRYSPVKKEEVVSA